MYLNVEHFIDSCSFDFSFDDDPDLSSCTASFKPASLSPFLLSLSSEYFGDLSYVITPIDRYYWIFTDPDEERACRFNPANCTDDIAEDINEVIEDEDMSSLIAYTLVSLCLPKYHERCSVH